MPIELQVIRASEFVCLDANEILDFEATKKALQSLAQACRKRGLDRALLDLRALPMPAKPVFTPTQLAALIGTFHEAGFGRNQRLAVLYRIDPHRGVRTFAFIGRIQGWQVRAFGQFEEALHWLSEQTINPARQLDKGIPIPIAKRQSEPTKVPVSLAVVDPALVAPRSNRKATNKRR